MREKHKTQPTATTAAQDPAHTPRHQTHTHIPHVALCPCDPAHRLLQPRRRVLREAKVREHDPHDLPPTLVPPWREEHVLGLHVAVADAHILVQVDESRAQLREDGLGQSLVADCPVLREDLKEVPVSGKLLKDEDGAVLAVFSVSMQCMVGQFGCWLSCLCVARTHKARRTTMALPSLCFHARNRTSACNGVRKSTVPCIYAKRPEHEVCKKKEEEKTHTAWSRRRLS